MIAAKHSMFGTKLKNPYPANLAMWDCKWNAGLGVHDSYTTQWVDILGGIGNASVVRNTVAFNDKSIGITNSGRLLSPSYSIGSKELTMEFVARRIEGSDTGELGVLFENPWFGINLRPQDGGGVRFTCGGDYDFSKDITAICTYTLVRSRAGNSFYANGVRLGGNTSIANTNTKYLAMGCWQENIDSSVFVTGDIFAVRMSDYAFSINEVLYSCGLDQKRFGFLP